MWEESDYDSLSNGGGLDFDADGVKGHISSLGIPAAGNEPNCKLTLGDDENVGKQSTDSTGLPGVSGQSLHCLHDWDC